MYYFSAEPQTAINRSRTASLNFVSNTASVKQSSSLLDQRIFSHTSLASPGTQQNSRGLISQISRLQSFTEVIGTANIGGQRKDSDLLPNYFPGEARQSIGHNSILAPSGVGNGIDENSTAPPASVTSVVLCIQAGHCLRSLYDIFAAVVGQPTGQISPGTSALVESLHDLAMTLNTGQLTRAYQVFISLAIVKYETPHCRHCLNKY